MVVNDALTMIGPAVPRSPRSRLRAGPCLPKATRALRRADDPTSLDQAEIPADVSFKQKFHTLCAFAPSFPQTLPETRP